MEKLRLPKLPIVLMSLIFVSCLSTGYGSSVSSKKGGWGDSGKKGGYTAQDYIVRRQYDRAKELVTSDNVNSVDSAGNTVLHVAAEMDNAPLVEYLLSLGAHTTIRNRCGDMAIHIAVNNRCAAAASVLSKIGDDVFARDEEGLSAIEIALEKGGDVMAGMINGETARIVDAHGQTILHYIARSRNESAVDDYIAKKLPLSPTDNAGQIPLALSWKDAANADSVRIGAKLVCAGSELVRGAFSYFEDALKSGNMMIRFGDGQTPLSIAATQGHTGIVAYVVRENPNVSLESILSVRDKNNNTPLHEAVRSGNSDVVRLLLEHGANVNAVGENGKTPVLLSISGNEQYRIYEMLVRHGADVRRGDFDGNTVFHVASASNCPKSVLEFFLSSGAPVDVKNNQGVTPLSVAVANKNRDHVLFYLKNGADCNLYDSHGSSPLTLALAAPSDDMLRLMVTAADARPDVYGSSPLIVAVSRKARISAITYFVGLGFDVNARNNDGDSALLVAAAQNRRDVCELLLSKNADIFASNKLNNSPLRVALVRGAEMLDWFIRPGRILSADSSGNTPLHYAAEWKCLESILYLIENGAKAGKKNNAGESPLFSAVKADSVSALELLLSHGAELDSKKGGGDNEQNTLLHAAVRWNSAETAKFLVSLGCDVNAKNAQGMTALDLACEKNSVEMAQSLIAFGADCNTVDSLGRTNLMKALSSGNDEVALLLLDSGADVSVQDSVGRTALHEASVHSSPELIARVRGAGGNPFAHDNAGDTPFSLSLRRDSRVSLSVLGGDGGICDDDGNTAVHAAVRHVVNGAFLSLLHERGFLLDSANNAGETPLFWAVSSQSRVAALFLLSAGASPFARTLSGDCPLVRAFETKDWRIIDGIVAYGAAKTDEKKNTILHYAAQYADTDVVELILSLGKLSPVAKNEAGETPARVAARLKRAEVERMFAK